MDNQHRKIKGYRELSQKEIDLMNEIKTKGAEIGELVEKMKSVGTDGGADDTTIDMRWINIGATHLQQGLMALTRAIARPDFF